MGLVGVHTQKNAPIYQKRTKIFPDEKRLGECLSIIRVVGLRTAVGGTAKALGATPVEEDDIVNRVYSFMVSQPVQHVYQTRLGHQ